MLVIASIGSEGLLGLLSYLPHQLDLHTGQLWADAQSTADTSATSGGPGVRVYRGFASSATGQ